MADPKNTKGIGIVLIVVGLIGGILGDHDLLFTFGISGIIIFIIP
jgi:hypothetical protein